MRNVVVRIVRWSAASVFAVLCTWAFFGPVGAFHWMIRFGVLGFLIYDEENGPADLRFSAPLFVASLIGWLLCVAVGVLVFRASRQFEKPGFAADPEELNRPADESATKESPNTGVTPGGNGTGR